MEETSEKYFVSSKEQLVTKVRRRLRKRRLDEEDQEDSRCDTIWKIVTVILIGDRKRKPYLSVALRGGQILSSLTRTEFHRL
jgi:hypothetical protein